jgi:hypothetical protein
MTLRPFRLLALAALLVLTLAVPGTALASAGASTAGGVESRADILIERDTEFDLDHGVRSGRGTAADPYVISGWHVGNLRIHDTMSKVTIRGNEITGTLTLDWIGPGITVVDNTVGDLRVNQNVERSGAMTGGRIAHNTFRTVGQLRHWDGVFERNRVGVPGDGSFFGGGTEHQLAVNFDGFNGARFRNNLIYGALDVKLHGHHHGSGWGMPSHDHSAAMAEEHAGHGGYGMEPMVDHTKRYHEVWVSGNTIHSTTDFALRYNDLNHAGDDRTAPSETDPELEKPHLHYTRVHLTGNRLIGAGVVIDTFNATDDHHITTKHGLVEVRGNRITLGSSELGDLFGGRDGIRVFSAVDADLRIVGNVIEASKPEGLAATQPFRWFDGSAGIRLQTLDLDYVYVDGNRVTNRMFGVVATQFTETVRWWVRGLSTSGVSQDVVYDTSVPNPPSRS